MPNKAAEQSRAKPNKDDTRSPMLLVLAMAVIIVGIVAAWFISDMRARQSAEARAEDVLLDSAVEQTFTFSAMIDGQYRLLEAFAEHLEHHYGTDREGIIEALSMISPKFEFSYVCYVDLKGAMYFDGETSNVWGRQYFQDSLNGEKGLQYVAVRRFNVPAVAVSVPYVVNGKIEGVICGWMDEHNLQGLITSKAYGGYSYSLLVNSDGKALIYADSEYMLSQNGSLSYLENADFDDGVTYQEIISRLKSGESFTFRFTYQGNRRVVAVAPMTNSDMPQNDWFVANAVSQEFLENEIAAERRNSLELLYALFVCGFIAVALILLYREKSLRAMQKSAEELEQREECFRIAASQTGRFVFRYDIPTQTYYHITGYKGPFEQPQVVKNLVEEMIAKGAIAPESAAAYREFFQTIDDGKTPPDTDIKLMVHGGGAGWYRFSATLAFASDGKATTAVVSYVECDEQREREMAYSRWMQEMQKLPRKNTVLLEWNITQNIFESERGDARVSPGKYESATFDEVAGIYAGCHVFAEDRQAYLSLVNRAHLLGMYHSNATSAQLDYREVQSGVCRWMRLTVRLVMYPTSTDIKAYIAVVDVDEEKQAELSLIAKSEMDQLTGAYNRGAFVDRVRELIAKQPNGNHLFMMLDIDDFKAVNDTFGHDFGDKLLQSIPETARRVLRTNDFIGRVGGDEFMICLENVAGVEAMKAKAAELIRAFSQRVSETQIATVSMGASAFPKDGCCFEELYKKADIAMYRIKKNGKNDFCFYEAGMEESGNVHTSFVK